MFAGLGGVNRTGVVIGKKNKKKGNNNLENEKELCKIIHKYEKSKNRSERSCVLSPYEEYIYENVVYFKVLRVVSDLYFIKSSVVEKFGVFMYNSFGIYLYIINGRVLIAECPPTPKMLCDLMKDVSNFHDTQKFIRNTTKLINKMYYIRRKMHKGW